MGSITTFRKKNSTKWKKNGFLYFLITEMSIFAQQKSVTERKRNNITNSLKPLTTMKGLSILAAFLGGAAVGAACGILFAPEKGDTTRTRIAEAIRKRGVKLSGKELESLVDDIAEELQPIAD